MDQERWLRVLPALHAAAMYQHHACNSQIEPEGSTMSAVNLHILVCTLSAAFLPDLVLYSKPVLRWGATAFGAAGVFLLGVSAFGISSSDALIGTIEFAVLFPIFCILIKRRKDRKKL